MADIGTAARNLIADHPTVSPSLLYVLESIASQYDDLELEWERALRWLQEELHGQEWSD